MLNDSARTVKGGPDLLQVNGELPLMVTMEDPGTESTLKWFLSISIICCVPSLKLP